jgi:hypothetical protein
MSKFIRKYFCWLIGHWYRVEIGESSYVEAGHWVGEKCVYCNKVCKDGWL